METLILQVNCKPSNRNRPPQLGITVEAPYSVALQQRQQQSNNDYRNHDYQNCHMPNISNNNHNQNGSTNKNSPPTSNNYFQNNANNKQLVNNLSDNIQRGLQITQIQEGSVIDRNGLFKIGDIIVEVNNVNLQRCTFQEAQKTLREFVVKHSSHGPLLLKVLRKAASSSSIPSIPSTTDSQSTVIERNRNSNHSTSNSAITTIPSKTSSFTATTHSSQSTKNARRDFNGAFNTRKIGTKHRIQLTKSNDGGFGIKIAERDNMFGTNRPIYITAITTTGSAYRDGRLREGDMLLEVNGVDITAKSQPEVTKMLKAVPVNESVEFVISRQEDLRVDDQPHNNHSETQLVEDQRRTRHNICDNNKSLIDLDGPDQSDSVFGDATNHQFEKKIDSIFNVPNLDGPGTYVYDVPLNDTKSAGLGLYLKYPTLDCKDLGIWIEKVITGGAAWKDGRLQPDDQILAINGINLVGLSNSEASETLMAAVCRGIGPEATSNTIRLNIHRRDPAVIAKILHGTDNKIEHSDLPSKVHNNSYSFDKKTDNTQDSYQTALDNTAYSKSISSSNDTSGSNKSSNDLNSQSDSAMSPQTQASNSLKLSTSCNPKSEHNSSSDKTNNSSSAISQITDFTTVQVDDNATFEIDPTNSQAFTIPKALEVGDEAHSVEPASSVQSWDDESFDAVSGEERFQRDGFGRQSISEKRHAQLMAKNTDTYKRNQKLREERTRQRQLEEQLERQHLDDNRRLNYNFTHQHQRLPNSFTANELNSVHHRQASERVNLRNDIMVNGRHREVPVDVQVPVEPGIEIEQFNTREETRADFSPENQKRLTNQIPEFNHIPRYRSHYIDVNCWKCEPYGPCRCRPDNFYPPQHQHNSYNYHDNQGLKRSNSLESIQHTEPFREGLIVPRAGTVRVARNRKINESFRAAVDRSYEGSTNDSGRSDYAAYSQRRSSAGTKVSNSVANSTASTSNDERYLIKNPEVAAATHKKSSLLTKFLKFGSMKKKDKKKNKDSHTTAKQPTETNNNNMLHNPTTRYNPANQNYIRMTAPPSISTSGNLVPPTVSGPLQTRPVQYIVRPTSMTSTQIVPTVWVLDNSVHVNHQMKLQTEDPEYALRLRQAATNRAFNYVDGLTTSASPQCHFLPPVGNPVRQQHFSHHQQLQQPNWHLAMDNLLNFQTEV